MRRAMVRAVAAVRLVFLVLLLLVFPVGLVSNWLRFVLSCAVAWSNLLVAQNVRANSASDQTAHGT